MKPPRGLTADEAALWRKVTATVKPLRQVPPLQGEGDQPRTRSGAGGGAPPTSASPKPPRPLSTPRAPLHPRPAAGGPPPPSGEAGLDSTWERKLRGAKIEPDFTLDLHGHSLDAAHARLESGLAQARAMGARLVLVITGRLRPAEAADRGQRRGAIRAKVLDWLAAGAHASSIAAIRNAHRRHGGEGALYIVLRRERGRA